MSGFEIYTRKEKITWDIACLDIGVTFIALTTIFVALFSVFTMPYSFSYILLLQGIAIPLAIVIVWGKKFKILRMVIVGGIGVGSYMHFKINVWYGLLPCINSAIKLINQCYNIDLPQQMSNYGYVSVYYSSGDKISFLWTLCVLEFLFAAVLLKVLKRGKGRFAALMVFLLPVILGIFCGKVPDVTSGCCLIGAIFLFLIVSYQREQGIPVRALASAAVLLAVLWMGSRAVESSVYDYKMGHLKEYQEMKVKLIEARQMDLADWIPEKVKQETNKIENELEIIEMGVDWNSNFRELNILKRTGEVLDEVVIAWKPQETVYWPMYEGYVYNGETWVEQDSEGIYDELIRVQKICQSMENYSTDRIATAIDRLYEDGFVYTLSPGKMPEDMDFVEGFLFRKKAGFCVHFATAATVIYQMCGKDARYVEGYAIKASDFKLQPDGKYKAVVTDYMAHAWCETYEQFSGWEVREHTPSSGLYTENPTPTPTKEAEVMPTVTPTVTPITQEPEQQPTVIPDVQENNGPALSGDQPGEGESPHKVWEMVKAIFTSLVSVVVGLAGTIGVISLQRQIRVKRRLRRFRSKHVKKAILSIYRAIQELCKFAGLKDKEMWRREHMAEIAEQFPQISQEEWEWIYDCAERTMFSNHLMLMAEQKEMYRFYQQLRNGIFGTLTRGKKIWFLYGRAW